MRKKSNTRGLGKKHLRPFRCTQHIVLELGGAPFVVGGQLLAF